MSRGIHQPGALRRYRSHRRPHPGPSRGARGDARRADPFGRRGGPHPRSIDDLWEFILVWGIIVGTGAGGMSSVLAASVAHRWFVRHRGVMLGFLNSAGSTGQLIFIPVVMGDHHGLGLAHGRHGPGLPGRRGLRAGVVAHAQRSGGRRRRAAGPVRHARSLRERERPGRRQHLGERRRAHPAPSGFCAAPTPSAAAPPTGSSAAT